MSSAVEAWEKAIKLTSEACMRSVGYADEQALLDLEDRFKLELESARKEPAETVNRQPKPLPLGDLRAGLAKLITDIADGRIEVGAVEGGLRKMLIDDFLREVLPGIAKTVEGGTSPSNQEQP